MREDGWNIDIFLKEQWINQMLIPSPKSSERQRNKRQVFEEQDPSDRGICQEQRKLIAESKEWFESDCPEPVPVAQTSWVRART